MTSTELKQKHLTERREFYLAPDRMRIYIKDTSGEVESFIDYESLTPRRRSLTQQSGWLHISAISFGIFGLVGVALNFVGVPQLMRWAPLWIVASVIFFAFYLAMRRRYTLVDLDNGKALFFLYNKPSKEQLEQFLAAMYQVQREYLRRTYLAVGQQDNVDDELRKFQWLLKQGMISDTEFAQAKAATIALAQAQQSDVAGRLLQ